MSIDLSGIRVQTLHPSELDTVERIQIRNLAVQSFTEAMPQDIDVAAFLQASTSDSFIEERSDPNKAVEEGRLFRNQRYYNPEITVAFDGDYPVGYAFLASNVSGRLKTPKRLVRPYNWLTIKELAVKPDFQDRGIGHAVVALAVHGKSPHRKVSTYVVDESKRMLEELMKMKFKETASFRFQPSGFSEPTNMHRLITNVNQLEYEISSNPTLADAIQKLKSDMGLVPYGIPQLPSIEP